jgi:diguanylate cyclase (GGDEF)-like protein
MVRRLSVVGGYVAAGLALIVFWWLRRVGLLAATPYWLILVFLAISCAGDVFGRLLQRRWPESVRCDRVRFATAAVTTALVLYATGWGSMLVIGFAVGGTQVLGQSARPDWRWAYGCNLVAIGLGEAAIQLGVAPTLINMPLAHAIAFVGALCLAIVLWILGEALVSAQTNEQLVLEREESLLRQATHDPLTGLPNRTLFNDRLEHALARRSRVGGYVAVMVVDLDGFKNVNDSLGHLTGDALLIAVADRFAEYLRDFDTIARLGGDEFAILVDDLDAPDQAEHVAQRVLDALASPLELRDRSVAIGASIGIALADRADGRADRLLSAADAAMYRAKREGKGCYRIFEAEMHTAAVERMTLEQALRTALTESALTVHYQPVIDTTTGHVTSFEALARWEHATRGFIGPDTFIPLAEDSGLILDLGHAVLLEACQQAHQWHREFPDLAPRISINASRLQLVHPSFTAHVADALARAELDPAALTLEVTESVLAGEPGRIIATLDELRRTGIRVAIDDFGTGYSSFAALADLPIDILKIDKRFIDNIVRTDEGYGIVKAIMQLAQTLHLETIAEGVEQPEQQDALIELGCTQLQGYLYSPALPADHTSSYLQHKIATSTTARVGVTTDYPPIVLERETRSACER